MTEKLIRDALKEAQEKGQLGLLIWANWNLWDEWVYDMKPGNPFYDLALFQISKKKELTLLQDWNSFTLPGIIAISVEKLKSSEELFSNLLDTCNKGNYEGPITLVPLNEVAVSCVEK